MIKNWALPGALFVAVFLSHSLSRVTTAFDSRWTIHAAMSLLREGNLDLDEYHELLAANDYYMIVERGGHLYNFYPAGVTLLAAPLVFVAQYLTGPLAGVDLRQFLREGVPGRVEKAIASFFVALTAVLIFLLGHFGSCAAAGDASGGSGAAGSQRLLNALALSLIFAFCTPAWSTASRALWQQGPGMLMLSAALLLIVLARRRPHWIQFAGLPLAYALAIRPTNAIPAGLLAVYIFLEYRPYFYKLLLWGLPLALFFIIFNLSIYGSLLSGYGSAFKQTPPVDPWGLAGTLISPSRGLFVWSPILLLAFYGLRLEQRTGRNKTLHRCLLLALLLHWLLFSLYPVWWGGHSIGPRYFCETVPLLLLWLLPALERYHELRDGAKLAYGALGAALIALSFCIHCRAANHDGALEWNVLPVNIDQAPGRVWDWSDPQFLRGWGAA